MIFKTNNPTSPDISIEFNGVAFNYLSILQLKLELGENQHDLLRVHVGGLSTRLITDLDGVAVSCSWKQGNSGHEFRGYVSYIEPVFRSSNGTVNDSPFQEATIYCLGVSSDMKAKKSRLWEEPTLLSIVQTMARDYRFSYSIPVDSFSFPRLTQNSESDWGFLVRVVDLLGLTVTLHGTHLHIFDRHKAIGRQISYHRLTVPLSTGTMKTAPAQIMSLEGTFGTLTPYSNANSESITFLDNRGILGTTEIPSRDSGQGRVLNSNVHDQIVTNFVSPDLATKIVNSRARKKFPYEANIGLTGTSGIKPGGTVNVDKFGARFDGLWYVSSATHIITLDKYFTDIKVIKDSTNDDPFRIPPVSPIVEPPRSVLQNLSWRAATQMEDSYG